MKTVRALVALAIGTVAWLGAGVAHAAPPPRPVARVVGSTTVSPGDKLLVQGDRWPPRTLVHLDVCGNLALDSSADCDLSTGFDAGVGEAGNFSMLLTAGRPPVPCPCAVWVTDPATPYEARVPITLLGVPTADVHETGLPDVATQLRVAKLIIHGHGSWTSWFGAGSHRTLELWLHNTAPTAIPGAVLSLSSGKGANPTGFVSAPGLSTIDAGATVKLRIPIPVGAFSHGRYTVAGEVAAFGNPLRFSTAFSVGLPWGLLVIALLVVQVLLLIVRNRVRDRLDRRTQAEETPGAMPEDAPAPHRDELQPEPPPVLASAPISLPAVASAARAELPDEPEPFAPEPSQPAPVPVLATEPAPTRALAAGGGETVALAAHAAQLAQAARLSARTTISSVEAVSHVQAAHLAQAAMDAARAALTAADAAAEAAQRALGMVLGAAEPMPPADRETKVDLPE